MFFALHPDRTISFIGNLEEVQDLIDSDDTDPAILAQCPEAPTFARVFYPVKCSGLLTNNPLRFGLLVVMMMLLLKLLLRHCSKCSSNNILIIYYRNLLLVFLLFLLCRFAVILIVALLSYYPYIPTNSISFNRDSRYASYPPSIGVIV